MIVLIRLCAVALIGSAIAIAAAHAQLTAGGAGTLNYYTLFDYSQGGYQTTSGKTQVISPTLGAHPAVFIMLGQSLEASEGDGTYTATNTGTALNLNPYDQNYYRCSDPVLGSSGNLGGWGCRFADKLINAGTFTSVIIIPIAIGASSTGDWCTGSKCTCPAGCSFFQLQNHRFLVAWRLVQKLGLAGANVGIHLGIGETDCQNSVSQAATQNNIQALIDFSRGAGFTGPWFINQESWTGTTTCANTQNAQAAVVNNPAGVYAGANFDANTTTWRKAGGDPHFNTTGQDAGAAAVVTAVQNYPGWH